MQSPPPRELEWVSQGKKSVKSVDRMNEIQMGWLIPSLLSLDIQIPVQSDSLDYGGPFMGCFDVSCR